MLLLLFQVAVAQVAAVGDAVAVVATTHHGDDDGDGDVSDHPVRAPAGQEQRPEAPATGAIGVRLVVGPPLAVVGQHVRVATVSRKP